MTPLVSAEQQAGAAPPFKTPIPGTGGSRTVTTADDAVTFIAEMLALQGWQGEAGEFGTAMVQLFGRLAELVINRLNQAPDKHFLAFLDEAGIDLLAPRAAAAELTFIPAKDSPAVVRVPAGTQVATAQTETQAEVIFETRRDLNVALNSLVACIAFDRRDVADRTAEATGEVEDEFPVFEGQQERERILYLGSDGLFLFEDDTTRAHATVNLDFQFETPGKPDVDGWSLVWEYWDGQRAAWADLEEAGATVTDGTADFSQDESVVFGNLPAMGQATVDGQTGLWLRCRLTGGSGRENLPVIRRVQGSRSVSITTSQTAADGLGFSAVQGNAAFVALPLEDEFLPLGPVPSRLDTLYIMSDEAFSKPGAAIVLTLADLEGTPTTAQSTDLTNLRVTWEYFSSEGWQRLGVSSRSGVTNARLNFQDTTRAFTVDGDTGTDLRISFTVPLGTGGQPAFAKTTINDQEGLWLRARLTAGGYRVPAEIEGYDPRTGDYTFLEAANYAPVIRELRVTYSGYGYSLLPQPIPLCRSSVDGMGAGRDHAAAAASLDSSFAPFAALDEGPSLYLGFSQAFPADEWMQILLDVEEQAEGATAESTVFWEYWNGRWTPLRLSDGSRGFTERGYLGFFGPDDHLASTAFGQTAYWFRARCHQPPLADAGEDQTLTATGAEGTVTLDAGKSVAFDSQGTVARYTWNLISSQPPVADPGADLTANAVGDEGTVTLDASASQGAPGRPIVRYLWSRSEEPAAPAAATAAESPRLRVVRLNTVAADNAVTLRNETLGASNGKPDQVFTLLRPPVLPGAQIIVREPDRPAADELAVLQRELKAADPTAKALPAVENGDGGTGVWVRWHQVTDFYASQSSSRHFTLDPIAGEVRFGDGQQGRIPPIGSNNVRALVYRTHDGAEGNADADTITVVRNPSGDLANIKKVTNPEAAAGGSDAETTDEVKVRGPQSLKHRQRAVTMEDYMWLALESSGEIANARCLPTRNQLGLAEAGWVTVVVTPDSDDAKPTPSPSLIRHVRSYLEARALANLGESDQIVVTGPSYIEATVKAHVVPEQPEKADEVELAVLERLETFLHPLRGGPERKGWELGRDVYLSEVFAEIERVDGVDHVASATLQGSIQQHRLVIGQEADLSVLAAVGFAPGNIVSIVAADDTPVVRSARIGWLTGPTIVFDPPPPLPTNWSQRAALLSPDRRVRLALADAQVAGDGTILSVTVSPWQRPVPYPLPAGAQVGTFDERYKALLADPMDAGQALSALSIYGFKVGDTVAVVKSDNTAVEDDLEIAAIAGNVITFDQPFAEPSEWAERNALLSADGRLRLPLAGVTVDAEGKVAGVAVQPIGAGQQISIVVGNRRDPLLEFLSVTQVRSRPDRIFVPEGHLVFSGSHTIEMELD